MSYRLQLVVESREGENPPGIDLAIMVQIKKARQAASHNKKRKQRVEYVPSPRAEALETALLHAIEQKSSDLAVVAEAKRALPPPNEEERFAEIHRCDQELYAATQELEAMGIRVVKAKASVLENELAQR